jgi:hypothetical protein
VSNDTVIRTWYLDEADVAPAIAKLSKINAKAAAHGLAGRYSYRLGEVTRRPVYLDALEEFAPKDAAPDHWKITQEFIVEGEPPKLNGWSFLAILTWDAGVLVTRTTPGFTGTIDGDAIRPHWCDHCRTDRFRNDTYLVARDSVRKQVGSTCIRDFLGHQFSPHWITGSDLDDMERSFGARDTLAASPEAVLAWAASLTGKHGWISRAKAETEYVTPSSSILRDLIFSDSPKAREVRRELRPTESHQAEAAKVLEWARSVEPGDSEYLANVRRLAEADEISPRNAGIFGSAVAAYWRESSAKAERDAAPVSRHIGQQKDRLELDVTVRGETTFGTDFGITHLYTLVTTEGNVLKWFSSRDAGLETGCQLRIRGTVKDHETYHEVAQTILTPVQGPGGCRPGVACGSAGARASAAGCPPRDRPRGLLTWPGLRRTRPRTSCWPPSGMR